GGRGGNRGRGRAGRSGSEGVATFRGNVERSTFNFELPTINPPHLAQSFRSSKFDVQWWMFNVWSSRRQDLLRLHHPHAVPVLGRVRLEVFAALDVGRAELVTRVQRERLPE